MPELSKSRGEEQHAHNYQNYNKSQSRSVHYKEDKIRGMRRRADRHTHHRRRQIQKMAIKNGIEDYIIPPSSSILAQTKGSWGPHSVAQSKNSIGGREQFYLSSPKKKPFRRRWPEFFVKGTRAVRAKIPVTNIWHSILGN